MPAGAEAKESAFSPNSQGKMAASAPRTAKAQYQTISSLRKKFGKNRICRTEDAVSQGGVLIPFCWTNRMWRAISAIVASGRIITWKAKNRVSVGAPKIGRAHV